MLLSCEYCGAILNGEIKLLTHKIDNHRKEYLQEQINTEKHNIEVSQNNIERWQEKLNKMS